MHARHHRSFNISVEVCVEVKIMMVAPRLDLGGGGSEKQTIELANGFARNGCKVTILLTDKKMDMTSQLSGEVEVISCSSSANFFSRLRFVYKTAKKRSPDILYSRFWTTKPAVILAGRVLGIKTVAVEVSNIKESLKRWPPIVRNAIGFAKVLCYRIADSVIVQSDAGKKSLSRLGIGGKIQVVYNGMDIERINKKSREEATHRWFDEQIPVAVAVGRLVPSKGYEYLLETLSAVNIITPLRLLLVGDGTLKNELISKARKLGIEDKIDFAGSVHNPHKYSVRCDVFICSSLFEGFSNSLLEALALGLPVVSTNHNFGASEIIEDGKSGILVQVRNPEKMAEAVLMLLQDKVLAAKMGEEAKNRAEVFSVEKMIQENLRIFRKTQKDLT